MVSCFPPLARYMRMGLELHTSSTPYYSDSLRGSASVHSSDPDATYEWTGTGGARVGSGARVDEMLPGVYRVKARGVQGTSTATVEVPRVLLPTVVGYHTTPASPDGAWDGCVVASVGNVDTHSFLWSTGAITLVPELRDVSSGPYSVSILDARHRAVAHVHACGSAIVGTKPFAPASPVP